MAKWANDKVMDKGLEYLAANATRLYACGGQPADYTEATGAKALGFSAITPGEFALVNGLAGGRRLSVPAKADLTTTVAGLADHFALVDMVNQDLLYVTTTSAPQQTYAQNTISAPSWDVLIQDPT